MTVELNTPLGVEFAGMEVSETDGTAIVEVVLRPTSEEAFA